MLNPELTQSDVKEIFEYKDGALYWRVCFSHRAMIGSRAGCHGKGGGGAGRVGKDRVQVWVKKKIYYAHRLIYLYHHGVLPKQIDHIDGNPLNNKIENLRAATNAQNQINIGLTSQNTTGYKGVYKVKRNKPYKAVLARKHIGYFATAIDAARAYDVEAFKIYGDFAWLNDV